MALRRADLDPLLVIGATGLELAPLAAVLDATPARDPGARFGTLAIDGALAGVRVSLRTVGIGKTHAAAGLARLLAEGRFAAVVQVGVGGAYAGSFLPVGSVAVADSEHDLDFGVRTSGGWSGAETLGFGLVTGDGSEPGNRVPVDPALAAWLSRDGALPRVAFGTSDAVSGDLDVAEARRVRFDLSVESMEGVAAAQAALAAGVPFGEVRGISNVAGQRDKRAWALTEAARAAADALREALRRVGDASR